MRGRGTTAGGRRCISRPPAARRRAEALRVAAGFGGLLEHGADLTARDNDGKFPADYADDNPVMEGSAVYGRMNLARANIICPPHHRWFWSGL